jgi:hypothetical protein
MSSDESVEVQELSLDLHVHTINLEMKQSLSLSSIESSSRSEEGSGGQQLSPELFNKAFSTKNTMKSLLVMAPCFQCINQVAVSW